MMIDDVFESLKKSVGKRGKELLARAGLQPRGATPLQVLPWALGGVALGAGGMQLLERTLLAPPKPSPWRFAPWVLGGVAVGVTVGALFRPQIMATGKVIHAVVSTNWNKLVGRKGDGGQTSPRETAIEESAGIGELPPRRAAGPTSRAATS